MPSVLSLAAILCASVALASVTYPISASTLHRRFFEEFGKLNAQFGKIRLAPKDNPELRGVPELPKSSDMPAPVEPAEAAAATPAAEESEDEDEEHVAPAKKVNATKLQEKREQEEGGTCCFSGESKRDTCGTCYPMSIASYLSKCSKKNECNLDLAEHECSVVQLLHVNLS